MNCWGLSSLLLICSIMMVFHAVEAKDNTWDYIKFTQEWAPSVCIEDHNNAKNWLAGQKESCKIPSNVTSWVIHGIWPTKIHKELPNFCNNSDKFNPSDIQSILPDLLKYWPNLYTDSPMYDFWTHEWTKHGTCALILPALDSELKYFTMGLKLNRNNDILSNLQKAGITPSTTQTYNLTQIHSALTPYYSPPVSCMYVKETKKQYVAQISICLDKTFKPIDCKSVESTATSSRSVVSKLLKWKSMVAGPESCRLNEPIYYIPLH